MLLPLRHNRSTRGRDTRLQHALSGEPRPTLRRAREIHRLLHLGSVQFILHTSSINILHWKEHTQEEHNCETSLRNINQSFKIVFQTNAFFGLQEEYFNCRFGRMGFARAISSEIWQGLCSVVQDWEGNSLVYWLLQKKTPIYLLRS